MRIFGVIKFEFSDLWNPIKQNYIIIFKDSYTARLMEFLSPLLL